MCGRIALTLDPALVVAACAYKRRGESKFSKPQWKDESNMSKKYSPSYNIAPTDVTPVMLPDSDCNNAYIIKPMMWGMVPPWHKGSYKTHGLTTNNCRLETMLTSKLYGASIREGKRCIVVAEGFYEWQTVNKSKQPYYIFSPQMDDVKMYDSNTWSNTFDEAKGWSGVKLLKMAALYNTWTCDGEVLYSYSIITMESNDTMKFIHHRMPAFLETDSQINDWLDIKNISAKNAIDSLKPVTELQSYPVSMSVNNSRFKDSICNKPIDKLELLKPVIKSKQNNNCGSKKLMNMWLKNESTNKIKSEDDLLQEHIKKRRLD